MEQWNEFVFQARLRYLAFKRCVWMFEMVMACIVVVIGAMLPLSGAQFFAVVVFAVLRVVSEALNHNELANVFMVPDRWRLLFPFFGMF